MVFWWRENNLSFEQECDFLRSLGFGVELWPSIRGQNDCRYARQNWPRLREATRDMLVSMHCRNDGPTLEDWDEQIQCAKMLNASIVVNLPSLCISEKLEIADWDFAADVVNLAGENNVKLCVETGSLGILKQLGEKFDSIWYCFDTGAVHIDKKFTFSNYVDVLAGRVAQLHLSDNYGTVDDHAPPGLRGGVARQDWDYLLNALDKYDNEVIGSFEMSPSMPDVMIRQGCEFLFDIMNWPNRPQKRPGYEKSIYRPG